jgi:hypothetical protein
MDLRGPLLDAVVVLGALALACELCGFISKERGRPVLRAQRKRSYTYAHLIRCAEAAFVVGSFWIPIHPKLWICLIDAVVFLHFRQSHKRVARRLEAYAPPRRKKDHPSQDGTIHIAVTNLRRLGVSAVIVAATTIPPLGSLGAAGAAIGHSLRSGTQSKGKKEEPLPKKSGKAEGTPKKSAEEKSKQEPNEPTPRRPPTRSDWNRKCMHEGEGAPRWAMHPIVSLYEGLGSVGPAFLGCTGKMHRYRGDRCREFVWALGENPAIHEILSLVSACKKPAFATVYRVPASGFVRDLIETERDHIVYGPHKITAGDGDMYLLETESGTYALVRSATGGESIQTYIELPPPVVQAWIGAMNEANEWLWPSEVETVASERIYLFAENGHLERALPEYAVTYREEEGEYVATRGPWKYLSREKREANTEELEQVAEDAKS